MKFKNYIFFAFFLSLLQLHAQQSINSSGGNVTGIGGTVNYSIGQVVYTTNKGTSGYVAQGVQNAYVITVLKTVAEVNDIMLSIFVYPNPSSEYILLDILDFEISNLSYQLYDLNGKLLKVEKITESKTNIIINHLIPAIYFLKVFKDNNEIKIFKIIKN